MKRCEKRQLLSKLKLINSLDRQQRFSQKVFRQLRSNNVSNDASFNKDDLIVTKNDKQTISSPMITPDHFYKQNALKTVREKKEQSESGRGSIKFKKVMEIKHILDCSDSKFPLQSYSKRSTERKQYQYMPSKEAASQTLSTMGDINCKSSERIKRRCKQCNIKIDFKDQQIQQLTKNVRQLKFKLQIADQKFQRLKKAVDPYINNVNLMTVIMESLSDHSQLNQGVHNTQSLQGEVNHDRNELKEAAKVNMWLLKQGKQKERRYINQTFRLKCDIDKALSENMQLRRQINQKQSRLRIVEEQLRYLQNNFSLRERLQMCRQQLYTFKSRYQQKSIQNKTLAIKTEELKQKLKVLTSLIGCAIIFDIQEKEKDKKYLKEILNRIDKYQCLTNSKLETNGVQYLKMIDAIEKKQSAINSQREKTGDHQVRKEQGKRNSKIFVKGQSLSKRFRKLYSPNYLILLGQQSITDKQQHVVIKPDLFIKIRSILDSKYIDYRIGFSIKFPQFCNSYLRNYQIQASEKKPYLISRQLSETEIKEFNINFIRQLMDQRIHDLPEVQVFRDMLLGKYEEDEIYFYLMCRHKFTEGSELENFISSGDPSKMIKYDKAKRIAIKITQKFGRTIQNFICHHISQRKVVRGNRQFIRLYYLLKLLLLLYRKVRSKKIQELKVLFNNILLSTKKTALNFLQFHELIRKNFDFLTRSNICSMFRETYTVYEAQKTQAQFYQCFVAACTSSLFIQELYKFDQKLQIDCQDQEFLINFKNEAPQRKRSNQQNYKLNRVSLNQNIKQSSNCSQTNSNYHLKQTIFHQTKMGYSFEQPDLINKLWPDSVHILCNQSLNKQYYQLCKSKSQKIGVKIQSLIFLSKVTMSHLVKESRHIKGKEQISTILNDAIYNLIEFLNKIEKRRLEHENEVNLASKTLGRFFKNKIYQFYNQMLQDINTISNTDSQNQLKRSKKYIEKKARASIKYSQLKVI